MERKFENGNVYSEAGEFLFSYYECGIDSSMSAKKKNELVDERENYLFYLNEERELQQQDLI